MFKLSRALAASSALLALLYVAPATAAGPKTWVSNAGTDSASCGAVTAPCRTLQQGHDNVAAGGEVGVLNPGDYAKSNTLAISKSVSIINDGAGEASILAGVYGGLGVYVSAGQGDVISLRGLVIDGQTAGNDGIYVLQASAAHIQNCVVRNFEQVEGGIGIAFTPTGNGQLFVSDTIVFNNGSSSPTSAGILIRPLGVAVVALDRVHVEDNTEGLAIDGTFAVGIGAHVVVRDSVFSGNTVNGIHAFTAPGMAAAFAYVERSSTVSNLQNGILAEGPGATVLLSNSAVTRNAVGIATANSGQLISYRNNRINNNIGPDGTATSFYTLN